MSSRGLFSIMVLVPTALAPACKWSASVSTDPQPAAGHRPVDPAATTVAVAASAAGPDEVTVQLRPSRRLVGAPTVELGPRGEPAQPLPLASLGDDAFQGTLRGLPADGVLTLAVFGRDQAGTEVRSYGQLAVAPVAPDRESAVTSPSGDLVLAVPPGALPERARVLVVPARELPAPADPRTRLLTGPYALGASAGAPLGQPARVELHVPAHVDRDRLDLGSLRVAAWDGARWTPIGGVAIESPHGLVVVAELERFAPLALLGEDR